MCQNGGLKKEGSSQANSAYNSIAKDLLPVTSLTGMTLFGKHWRTQRVSKHDVDVTHFLGKDPALAAFPGMSVLPY